MNEVALRRRIAALVMAAFLSLTGAAGTTAVFVDHADATTTEPTPIDPTSEREADDEIFGDHGSDTLGSGADTHNS